MNKVEYTIEDNSDNVKYFIPTGEWNNSFIDVMVDEKLSGLDLNHYRGFRCSSLNFLEGLAPFLEHLRITGISTSDFLTIYKLKNLRTLMLGSPLKSKFDFTEFPNLTKVYINVGDSKVESIYQCKQLKQLRITEHQDNNLTRCASFKDLEILEIGGPTKVKTLDGIQDLKNLVMLGIYYARGLSDMSRLLEVRKLRKLRLQNCSKIEAKEELRHLKMLEVLSIVNCKMIKDLSSVSDMKNLREFTYNNNGEIDSLKFLSGLRKLEKVSFIESTKVKDGNIAFLLELPKLQAVHFQERRHYDCGREAFRKQGVCL